MFHRLLIIAAFSFFVAAPSAFAADRVVTVTGEGAVDVAPDLAEISVANVTQAKTASEAMAATSKKAEAVLTVAREAGIAEKDMSTGSVSLHPVYQRQKPGQTQTPAIVGYRASIQARLVIRDIKSVGGILDKLVQAGADNLGSLRFSVADQTAVRDKARAMAVKDAQRVATLLAEAAGAKLGPVQTIEETSGRPPIGVMRAAVAMERAVPVTPGEISVTTRVRVVFALED